MSNLSVAKKIAVAAVVVIVLMIPVILAFNDEGVQNALGILGVQSAAGDLDEYLVGDAKYNHSEDAAESPLTSFHETAEPQTAPSHTMLPGNTNIIAPVIAMSTPKPSASAVPSQSPKWVPVNPATDGEVIFDGLVEEDSINVLIIGVDRTAYLFDTIGVVSISREKKTVKLIMFSRDLYISYSEPVLRNIEKIKHNKLPGEYKFNNAYNVAKNTEKYADGIVYNDGRFENHAFDFLAQVVYEKFDILVDDFVRINTYGLIRLVDTFGGVSVYVPVYMRYNDPDQNLNINISKGTQRLNGTQAEGFVRFRQGYDSKGNLSVMADRTTNQIAFMKAFYEQHAKLSNVDKIPQVLDNLKRNIIHSITADDIFTQYIDVLTDVVNESYDMQSVNFKINSKKFNGSTYHVIEGILTGEEEQ